MSLLLDAPLGVANPQILLEPVDVVSHAAAVEAIELADAYGVAGGFPLDESERFTLHTGLGERADGSWAASTVADFEPRQNGKNDTCAARELAGLILFGEQLQIHTAHEFPTANESFLRLVAVFENWDDLRKRVARIRYANGEQGIELLTGQRLKYRARTGGSGRGFAKADLVVYDEAQHLRPEHVAASGPARLANPNSQSWYMGSGGLSSSTNAWRLRKRALAGERGRLAYVEHTAEVVSLVSGRVVSERPDVMSREAWARANSAYGSRIFDDSLLSMLDEMGPELFARECMCMWDPEPTAAGDGDLDLAKWLALAESPPPLNAPMFGADLDEAGAGWIAVAWRRPDSTIHVQLAGQTSVTALEERAAELTGKWGGRVMAGGAAAAALSEAQPVSSADFAVACVWVDELIENAQIRHCDEQALNDAVKSAKWRAVGTAGERAWQLKNAPGIGPLAAVTRAVHGLLAGPSVFEGRGLVTL